MKNNIDPKVAAVVIIILVLVVGAFGYKMMAGKPSVNKAEDAKHAGSSPMMSGMTPDKMEAMGKQMKAAEQNMAAQQMNKARGGGAPAQSPGGQ